MSTMRETIAGFNKQFEYEPEIKNPDKLGKYKKFVVCGMGGSNLSPALAKIINPELDIVLHRDYGLPKPEAYADGTLIIACSYSGGTEEVLDAAEHAIKEKLPLAAIAVGGKLLELAREYSLPYIEMPKTGIQPRSALGYSLCALLKIIGDEKTLRESKKLAHTLEPSDFEDVGKALAQRLHGFVPVIYSSTRNLIIAYNWKTKFNETGKIPAFYNIFPELNHDEMNGFDVRSSTSGLMQNFHFLFLRDGEDSPRIIKRMEVLEKLLLQRQLPVEIIDMKGSSVLYKIFSVLILADWTTYYTAEGYGVEPEQVPMVEEFKRLIK